MGTFSAYGLAPFKAICGTSGSQPTREWHLFILVI